jgi:hypothetical protein
MNKIVTEQFMIFCGRDILPEDWLWCRRCHRCYKAHEFRHVRTKGHLLLFCHYRDCQGDLPIDSKPWNKLVRERPELPETPSKEKVYDI